MCRTEENPDIPQAAKTTFMIEVPHEEWNDVREVKAMHGGTGHSEIVITDLRVRNDQMLGGRARGHLLGQYRPGPGCALHALDRSGRNSARQDGRPIAEPVLARFVARRKAGHSVDDC